MAILVPDWKPLAPVQLTTLTGRTVRVEPLSAELHYKDLYESFSADAEGKKWTYRKQEPFLSEDALRKWLHQIEEEADRFGIYVDLASQKATGMGALMSINCRSGEIELGSIMLSPALSQTTAATEAFFLQISWAFSHGFRRVCWTCDPLNAASARAAERLGFSYEAFFRQAYVAKGRNRDKAIFSITDAEWPLVQAAIQKWLAPENFDSAGQQLTSLSTLTGPLLKATMPPPPTEGVRINSFGQPIGPAVPQWTPPPCPDSSLVLQGRHVQLQHLTTSYAKDLHAILSQAPPEHWAYLPYGPFDSESQYTEWVEQSSNSSDTLFFVVLVGGAPAGVAAYLNIVPAHGSVEVGHLCFGPALQRSVAATEAMFLMMKWAFESGYRRYEWKCNARNEPSRRAAQRLGLSFEGALRHHIVVKGANRDTAYFAAVNQEWPGLKAAFEAWLDDSNFDDKGVQLRSLSTFMAA